MMMPGKNFLPIHQRYTRRMDYRATPNLSTSLKLTLFMIALLAVFGGMSLAYLVF